MLNKKQLKVSVEYVPEMDVFLAICKALPGVDGTGKTRVSAVSECEAAIERYVEGLRAEKPDTFWQDLLKQEEARHE